MTSSLVSVPEAFEIGSAAKLSKEFGKAADSEIKAAVIPLRNLLHNLFIIICFLSQNLYVLNQHLSVQILNIHHKILYHKIIRIAIVCSKAHFRKNNLIFVHILQMP